MSSGNTAKERRNPSRPFGESSSLDVYVRGRNLRDSERERGGGGDFYAFPESKKGGERGEVRMGDTSSERVFFCVITVNLLSVFFFKETFVGKRILLPLMAKINGDTTFPT